MNSDQLQRLSLGFHSRPGKNPGEPNGPRLVSDPLVDEMRPDSLEKRIRRSPGDLNAHVERILYYRAHNAASGCFAALADLFIVLGTRGFALRKRMLEHSAYLLSTYSRYFLETHLDSGISAMTPLPCVTSSILTDAVSGTTELVIANGAPLPPV